MTLKGHTNMTLAKTVGVSYQHLSSIRNKKINASPKLAKRIADTLGVEIEEIFTIEAKKEAN
ncbi:XRE family transcriptional regulator [Macrococcus hajekii]|uniref:XRE family transcriptional regulator n=1 Tax=Macrococcus hajekii TaxID=198482 RepID=A0A4R6BK66_9STAP|nr:helix-turn-helix transcriptional regulator [Macrococcus hajekii]TDM02119.1 XRE family transcriptional regulator [Macrococcus hajekii]